jgi:hypothetical protein
MWASRQFSFSQANIIILLALATHENEKSTVKLVDSATTFAVTPAFKANRRGETYATGTIQSAGT